MIGENSRKYLDHPSTVDAKALLPKGKDRIKPQEQSTGKGSVDYACHYCGSVDHWIKDCPHKLAHVGQPTGNQQYGSQNQSSNPVNRGLPAKVQPRSQPNQKGDKPRVEAMVKARMMLGKGLGNTIKNQE